jgi:ferredoxin-NADP reductase
VSVTPSILLELMFDYRPFIAGSRPLGALHDRYPGKVVIHPQDGAGLLDLPTLLAAPGATAVYCCGPEGLLAAVEERSAILPKATLHVERFAPKEGAADGPRESFEVAQTGTILTVPADRSVLDVVEDSGVHILSSCLGQRRARRPRGWRRSG